MVYTNQISSNSSRNWIKSIITILLLICTLFFGIIFGLVGIIVMWIWTKWPKWLKLFITVPFAVFLILILSSTILVSSHMFFLRPVMITGNSMLPNFQSKEYFMTKVIMNNEINRGEIVIFQPESSSAQFISRVIGIPGNMVEIREGTVYINGDKLNEPYLESGTLTNNPDGGFTKESVGIMIPNDSYFVLGDNRNYSKDSREFGLVPKSSISSKVMFCYWNCQ